MQPWQEELFNRQQPRQKRMEQMPSLLLAEIIARVSLRPFLDATTREGIEMQSNFVSLTESLRARDLSDGFFGYSF